MQTLDPEKRNAIIRTARTLFYRQGIRATTMQQVADEADLAVGTIYLYFRNKGDLILGCTEDFAAAHEQFVVDLKNSDLSWDAKLRKYVLTRFRLQSEMGKSLHGKDIARAVLELAPERAMAQTEIFVVNMLWFVDQGVKAGEVRTHSLSALNEAMTYAIGYFFPVAGREPLKEGTEEALARVLDYYIVSLKSS